VPEALLGSGALIGALSHLGGELFYIAAGTSFSLTDPT
jgi:hypothetical protein